MTIPNLTEQTKKILLFILGMTMLMEMLDASVLNTALPQMADNLHVSTLKLKIVLTIYFLSLGVFIPVSGWAADRFGEKNTLLCALTLFIASSMACGLSNNLPVLVVFRLLQGVGGAFLMPVGRQILVRIFTTSVARAQAMAYVNIIALMGLLLGPMVGGFLATYATWRWIFYLNIPFGLIGLYLIYYYLPIIRERVYVRFDLLGFILIATFLGSLLLLLDILVDMAVSYSLKFLLLTVSAASFFLYLRHAKHSGAPLISMNLFKQIHFRLATTGSFLSRLTTTTHPFLTPLLLQAGYNYTAFQSGLLTVPTMLSTLSSMFFLPYVLKRFNHHRLVIASSICLLITFCSYAVQTIQFNVALFIMQQILMGAFVTLQAALMNANIYGELSESYTSQGVTVNSGIIQISGSFGIAIAALTMTIVMGPNDLQRHVPLIAFRTVFLTQGLYLLWALYFFTKNYRFSTLQG